MPKIGYCGGCGRYIQLTPKIECPLGHPRSELRDVRDGEMPSEQLSHVAAVARAGDRSELIAQVIGKGIVIVPLALVGAFGVWTSYVITPGSPVMRLLLSVASMGITVGFVFLLSLRKRRR